MEAGHESGVHPFTLLLSHCVAAAARAVMKLAEGCIEGGHHFYVQQIPDQCPALQQCTLQMCASPQGRTTAEGVYTSGTGILSDSRK